jgi:hypothetical protein
MSLDTFGLNGYYDDNGNWQRTKFCFMACQRCDCQPPGGLHYSALHDHRLKRDKPPSVDQEQADKT